MFQIPINSVPRELARPTLFKIIATSHMWLPYETGKIQNISMIIESSTALLNDQYSNERVPSSPFCSFLSL